MAKLIAPLGARPAEAGEAKVIDHLHTCLPDAYTLLPNLEIAEQGRTPFEYDLIVVAPHAVYVVEIKNWRGGIRGDETHWLVAGRHQRPNPWPTANNKARVLKSRIQELQPGCSGVWVDAVVTIADEQGALQLTGALNQRVLRYTDLPAYLTDQTRLSGRATDARPLRAYLEKAVLQAGHARAPKTLTFGNFAVEETLVQADTVAEYLARNTLLPKTPLVRVRVFPYNPYLPPADCELREQVIRREAEALLHIGDHPNLIRLRHFDTAPHDPNLFYEVTDWSTEGALAGLLAHTDVLPLERKLEVALGITRGLEAVHKAEVIHRDLRPANVLMVANGQPRLMNFDRARLPVGAGQTISPVRRDPSVTRAYLAPELADNEGGIATPASDMYSFGAILFEMLAGTRLYESPEEAWQANTSAGGPAAFHVPDMPPRLNSLVAQLMKPDPALRPTAAETVAELTAISEQSVRPAVSPLAALPAAEADNKAIYAVGELIDSRYQVQAVLHQGGSGQVYKVYDAIFDQVYALKVFHSGSFAFDFLKQEAQALVWLDHPNTVRVYTWGQLTGSRFYLVSEYVDGEDLTVYTSGRKRLSVHEAVDLCIQLLTTLEAIHGNVERLAELQALPELTPAEAAELDQIRRTSYLHRDIKPANLILASSTLRVIDFNIATRIADAGFTVAGTPGYVPPEVGWAWWHPGCDVFGAGVVLYELITGQHPFPQRKPRLDVTPTDPRTYVDGLSPGLAAVLLQAVAPDFQVRYRNARQMREALNDLNMGYLVAATPPTMSVVGITLADEEIGLIDYNPFVTRLLSLYSQARRSNRGTRGLDEVAQLTYVDTLLDKHLLPDVLDGRYRLVIITGNAGDGKTAFIRKVEQGAEQKKATIERRSANASRFVCNGYTFVTNYDGSQDEGAERANDQVLEEFFVPFADAAPNPGAMVHLIAINEGRLIDFFDGSSQGFRFDGLSKTIRAFFDDDQAVLPAWLLIVDLNQRSVVAQEIDAATQQPMAGTSIFELQLEHLLRSEHWAACSGCSLAARCFIKFNADSLADPISGPVVRERLRTLFEIVHLRRKLHITMRDLRSALAWLIARDHNCHDVATMLATNHHTGVGSAQQLRLLYMNAFAADDTPPQANSDDRLVARLREIDVAEVANPSDDRAFYFEGLAGIERLSFADRCDLPAYLLKLLREELVDGWEGVQSAGAIMRRHGYGGMLRRLAYFERRDDRWLAMLPYQHLNTYRAVLRNTHDGQETRAMLAQGLSTLEGAHNRELTRSNIFLRASREQKVRVKSFRLFSIEEFHSVLPRARTTSRRYLEYLPDRFLLEHNPTSGKRAQGTRPAELIVTLDVWELLARVSKGYLPSLYDLGGHYLNLLLFKNALTHLHYRRALLTRDDRTFFEVRQEARGRVSLRRYQPGE